MGGGADWAKMGNKSVLCFLWKQLSREMSRGKLDGQK